MKLNCRTINNLEFFSGEMMTNSFGVLESETRSLHSWNDFQCELFPQQKGGENRLLHIDKVNFFNAHVSSEKLLHSIISMSFNCFAGQSKRVDRLLVV
jgi:hypothetical protein